MFCTPRIASVAADDVFNLFRLLSYLATTFNDVYVQRTTQSCVTSIYYFYYNILYIFKIIIYNNNNIIIIRRDNSSYDVYFLIKFQIRVLFPTVRLLALFSLL